MYNLQFVQCTICPNVSVCSLRYALVDAYALKFCVLYSSLTNYVMYSIALCSIQYSLCSVLYKYISLWSLGRLNLVLTTHTDSQRDKKNKENTVEYKSQISFSQKNNNHTLFRNFLVCNSEKAYCESYYYYYHYYIQLIISKSLL